MRHTAARLKRLKDAIRIRKDHGAAPLLAELAVLAGFLALLAWAAPDLVAWWRTMAPAPVQTSAHIACAKPSEFESLLVFINADADGTLRIRCGLAGGRGAYPGAR